MSYIGASPIVGNFQVCDAISVVNNQAAYTMQVGSANVFPESANHMLVSLNGILQKPNGSFTISGSTITFSSNLVTGDVIDFIQLLGDVLDIGTPSDATVTNAKTSFVSTSSAAGLQIKGDGTTDGTLQLNCSQNSHGIKLKSPPHSASASYTLTFPNNDGDANQALTTNGSGVLTWANAGGGLSMADQWRMSADLSVSGGNTLITANLEQVDDPGAGFIGSAMSVSSGIWTFPSTGIYLVSTVWDFSATGSAISQADIKIHTTTDNSTYDQTIANYSSAAAGHLTTGYAQHIFDVTNTSNCKVKFLYYTSTSATLRGSSTQTETGFNFLRLGDT